jgi:hypothetical protein
MRNSYVPRDVPESAENILSSEWNDSIRILNFKRSDIDINEGIVSHTIDKGNSSFTDDLRYSGPLNCIPSLTIIDEEDEMVK